MGVYYDIHVKSTTCIPTFNRTVIFWKAGYTKCYHLSISCMHDFFVTRAALWSGLIDSAQSSMVLTLHVYLAKFSFLLRLGCIFPAPGAEGDQCKPYLTGRCLGRLHTCTCMLSLTIISIGAPCKNCQGSCRSKAFFQLLQ